MAAPRKPAIDKIIDLYRSMDSEERRLVIPVLQGIARFTAAKPATSDEQSTFEEVGAAAAEDAL